MFGLPKEYRVLGLPKGRLLNEVECSTGEGCIRFIRQFSDRNITYVSERLSEELRVPRAQPDARTRNLSERLPRHKLVHL